MAEAFEAIDRRCVLVKSSLEPANPLLAIPTRCPACAVFFRIGDAVAMVPIGPGPDLATRQKCVAGKPYPEISIPVHWACATGL